MARRGAQRSELSYRFVGARSRHYEKEDMAVDTPKEVAEANAYLAEITKGTPIHGGLRTTAPNTPYPLVTCGVHCTECESKGAALMLLRTLADRGCEHAAKIIAATPSSRS